MEDNKSIALNIGRVYRHIYRNKVSSRQAIASDLGYSLPTVGQYLNQLKESGLIFNAGEFESTGGRKANMLSIVPDARYAVGVDITKPYIAFVLVDLNLNILANIKIHVPYQDTDEYYKNISEQIEQLLDLHQIDRQRLLGVGISLPVIVGEGQNTITYAEVIDIPKDVYGRLQHWMRYPYLLFNDANSAGWAELWVRDDSHPLVYLSLSNSVGGAIVLNRRVYNGTNWRGAEFGHITVVPHGKKCYCGCRGCLDAYCSAWVLSDFTDGDLQQFFCRLRENRNPGYRRIFEQYLEHLSIAVNNLRMCFDCDVVLGGNVGAFLEDYIAQFREMTAAMTPFEDSADYIKTSLCRTEPSAVGAALYFVDHFIRNLHDYL